MDLKKIIIICVVAVVIILGLIVFISVRSNNSSVDVDTGEVEEQDEEPVEELEEEIGETALVTFTNKTGKTIKELFLYNQLDVEGDEVVGYEVLDGDELNDGESIEVEIDKITKEAAWDVNIVTDDGEFEPEYLLGSDFMFEGSSLVITLNGDVINIDLAEEEEELEESEDEENYDEENDEHYEEENGNEEDSDNQVNDEDNEKYQEDNE